MRLPPFVPHCEVDDIQVNQKELYLDTEAIEDTDNFDENLPTLPKTKATMNSKNQRKRSTPQDNNHKFRRLHPRCHRPQGSNTTRQPH